MSKTLLITLFILFALSVTAFAKAGTNIDAYTFLRASSDERAVVKTPEGEMKVIKPGDEVVPGAKVVEIAPGRVVLEEAAEGGAATVIVRITGKGQKIQRIMRRPQAKPLVYAPSTVEVR